MKPNYKNIKTLQRLVSQNKVRTCGSHNCILSSKKITYDNDSFDIPEVVEHFKGDFDKFMDIRREYRMNSCDVCRANCEAMFEVYLEIEVPEEVKSDDTAIYCPDFEEYIRKEFAKIKTFERCAKV